MWDVHILGMECSWTLHFILIYFQNQNNNEKQFIETTLRSCRWPVSTKGEQFSNITQVCIGMALQGYT